MSEDTAIETKRERVRRLFIRPLEYQGFRTRRETSEEEHRKFLDRLADSLSYLTDDGLKILAASILTKGEGSAKCFWPSYATIIGWAESFQPRPLEEMPELLRWFASAAGRSALANSTLIAEYEFFRRKKRPPMGDRDRQLIVERSRELDRRAQLVREREASGLNQLQADDGDFLRWYEERIAYLEHLVDSSEMAEKAG